MRQSNKVDGTKIAQAAKDLNVTSVTIRRYIAEFGIETTSDENGIKVLPDQAMEELKEIRRLKEEGLTNPKVLEFLEDNRKNKPTEKAESKAKAKRKVEPATATAAKTKAVSPAAREKEEPAESDEDRFEEKEESRAKPEKKKTARRVSSKTEQEPEQEQETVLATEEADEDTGSPEDGEIEGEAGGDGKSKHSLTCQTCGKVFEHMNPRLRDCLECYRAKRKERRRGGADRHKNVIQHPIAQQAASKSAQQSSERIGTERIVAPPTAPSARGDRDRDRGGDRDRDRGEREPTPTPAPVPQTSATQVNFSPAIQRTAVRNYRKAIEETRQITGSLKRRLERPDLPEGERRWLEQIYAYQLILHQGWRHLAEYKAATQQARGGSSFSASAMDE